MKLQTRNASRQQRFWGSALALLFSGLVLALSGGHSAALTVPQSSPFSLNLSGEWLVYIDPTGTASLDEVRSRRYDFVPQAQLELPLAPLQTWWLRLDLENPGAQKITGWLELDVPLARNIQVALIDGPYIKNMGIEDGSSAQRRLVSPDFSFNLAGGSNTEVYLRLTRPWQTGFNARLVDSQTHLHHSNQRLFTAGFSFGGLLLLVFAALALARSELRTDYMLLALLASTAALYAVLQVGLLLLLAPVNDSGSRALQLAPLFGQACFLVALLLYGRTIELDGRQDRLARVGQWSLMIACTVALLLAPFDFGLAYYGLAILEHASLGLLLVCLIVSVIQGNMRMLLPIAGIVLYGLVTLPLVGDRLAPLLVHYPSRAVEFNLASTARYPLGLLLMLTLFSLAHTLRKHAGYALPIPASTAPANEHLVLQDLHRNATPEWWALTEASFDGVLVCEQGRVRYANQAAAELLQLNKRDITGKPISLLLSSGSDSAALLRDAAVKPVLLYPSGARNGDRQLEVTSRSQLIDQRQIHCLCLREHAPIQGDNALYDGLTGLAGAQLLREQVTRASKAAARKPSLHALLVIEIEQLAALKQRYGRQRTDRLMQALATRLTKSTRSENILSRIEQAQFALFVEDIANPSVAATVARQLLETIRRPVHIDEREMHCGGSIGIVLCPLDADNLPRLLLLGEQAIATARGHGANQFAFYNGEIHAAASREYAAQIDSLRASDELAASFVDAREQDLVRLVLQPVASLSPLERAGARAMPQWPGAAQDADIEQLYAMAEAAGGADALSEYLLQAVCTYCRHNRDDTQLIRVKIAASHFWRPHFVDEVAKALKTSGAYPQRIMLTFEEAMLSAEVKASAIKLHQLERLGCKLGLDQFANSNTSLLLLPNCAFAEVAISTAWIKSIGTSRQDLKTLRGMLTFCHQLAMQVRVDNVSTDNHLKVADAIGGDFASGSLIQQLLNSNPPDAQ